MVSKSPNWGCGTPCKWPFSWLIDGGDPNHLQTGMILPVSFYAPFPSPSGIGGGFGVPKHRASEGMTGALGYDEMINKKGINLGGTPSKIKIIGNGWWGQIIWNFNL